MPSDLHDMAARASSRPRYATTDAERTAVAEQERRAALRVAHVAARDHADNAAEVCSELLDMLGISADQRKETP